MPVIAKQLQISATAVGIGFSLVPIFMILSNPVFGFLADYFRNIKVFLIALLTTSCCAYSSVLGLPPIHHGNENLAYLQIANYKFEPVINISVPFERTCIEVLENDIQCELTFEKNTTSPINGTNIADYVPNSINVTLNINDSKWLTNSSSDKYWIAFYQKDNYVHGVKDNIFATKSFKCSPSIHQCTPSTDVASDFTTYQFWIFFVFTVIAETTLSSLLYLTSVACYEILGPHMDLYGRQRLFGTISWGIICSLAGIVNDGLGSKNFISGYYLMAVFLIIDIIIVFFNDIHKSHISTNISSDIAKILKSKEIAVFALGIVFIGFLTNVIVVYEFWFLEDMGASQTLLGLSIAVQCLLGEVPFMFFSGWFVTKFGHFLCFAGVFAAFALRLLLYSLLQNPWFVLPIEVLNGGTYGLYHVTMASFSKVKAPKGMEGTLIGVFGGLYDGLGKFYFSNTYFFIAYNITYFIFSCQFLSHQHLVGNVRISVSSQKGTI